MFDNDSRYADAQKQFAKSHTYDSTGKVINATAKRADGTDIDLGVPYERRSNTLYLMTTDLSGVRVSPNKYMLTVTDNVTLLAHRTLQDPTRWWAIADANPKLGYPLDWGMGDLVNVVE